MRIDRLDLTRFGCFTDCTLDLSRDGTHVIVGTNEAGKTTAMAAVRQLLYGIPVRTPHAFVHEMRDLSLGAALRDESGELLEMVRVKRQTDTLRGLQGEVLDDAVLARFLHDVDEAVYASLFTVGHDEIVRGGEALLASDGELGRALFSATRGTTDLNAVLRRLEERAAALFKNAASVPKLNAAIRNYKDETANVKALSKSASDVIELDEALQTAQLNYELTANLRKTKAQQKALLQRVRAARPQLATRNDCLSRKALVEAVAPLVDPALGPLLDTAQSQRDKSETARRIAKAAIDRLDEKLNTLTVDHALLGQRDLIGGLQTDSGGYRQDRDDLPGLLARAGILERALEQARRRIPAGCPLTADAQSAIAVNQEQRIQKLGERLPTLDIQLQGARTQVSETTDSLDRFRAELDALSEPADVQLLAGALDRIRKEGDLESRRATAACRLDAADVALANAARTLRLGAVDHRAIDGAVAPPVDTIRRVRSVFDKHAMTITSLNDQVTDLRAVRGNAAGALEDLLRLDEPPQVGDLTDARVRRDTGWSLIRSSWLDDAVDAEQISQWSDGLPLPDAYELAVATADTVADRLRDDATAVEQRASLEHQLDDCDLRLGSLAEELARARQARSDGESAWVQLWEPLGITPDSPAAMEAWHEGFRNAVKQAPEVRDLASQLAALDGAVARHRGDLLACVKPLAGSPPEGKSLAGLLEHAEKFVSDAATARQAHSALSKSIANTESLLQRHLANRACAEQTIDEWRTQWAAAVTALGLDENAEPSEASAVLKALSDITNTSRELAELQARVADIKRRNNSFTTGVAAILTKLDRHRDLSEADPITVVATLNRRVNDAQVEETTYRTMAGERDNHERDRETDAVQLAEASDRIDELLATAGLDSEAQLSEAISRSEEHADLVRRIRQAEDDLRQATGLPLSQIEAEASELEDVEIDPEIEDIDREIDDMDNTLKTQGQTVGELTTTRSLISSSDEAADAMTHAQQSLAAVATYADDYVDIVLAKRLLEEQVNAYRDKHQGPILQRARELFRTLTLSHYVGLDTDTDRKGNLQLLARTANDKLLEVSALSTGTRDQLYLALRLAALEQLIDRRGALPLVLDDLFVHFDDQRTAAGLAVLDQVANRAQVLLFTHHEQVAVQAAKAIDASRLTVHHLA